MLKHGSIASSYQACNLGKGCTPNITWSVLKAVIAFKTDPLVSPSIFWELKHCSSVFRKWFGPIGYTWCCNHNSV